MTIKHLTDETLQSIATGENASPEDQLHLHECPICQQQVQAYKLIIGSIAELPAPSLSFDLSAAVLNQLTNQTAPEPKRSWIWQSLFFIMAAVILIYAFRTELAVLFDGIQIITISLITVTVCTLLIFFCMDMFSTYRRKIHDLDLYS